MNIKGINDIEQLEEFLTGSQSGAFLVTSNADECYQELQHMPVNLDTRI